MKRAFWLLALGAAGCAAMAGSLSFAANDAPVAVVTGVR